MHPAIHSFPLVESSAARLWDGRDPVAQALEQRAAAHLERVAMAS
jgi:hypothetical protein